MVNLQNESPPLLNDGHDGNPRVAEAWTTLTAFGAAEAMTNLVAARLLPMWVGYGQLSPLEVAAVVRRFPRPQVPTLPTGVVGIALGTRR